MTSLDILEPSYCVDYSMQSSDDSKLSLSSPRLPLPTQVMASPSCPPPLSYYENNPKAKDELIQKATARLRCRLLQEGLTDVQSKVSQLRSQLDDLRIELATTENVLSKFGEPDNRQLQALERRFSSHQQQLDQVLSTSMLLPVPATSTPPTPKSSLSIKAITASTSFSSTLSRMSSIFNTSRQQKLTKKRADSIEVPPVPELIRNGHQYSDYSSFSSLSTSEEDDNGMDTSSMKEAREKRTRRRQRVKQLRREYQNRLRAYDPTWNEDGDWQSAHSPPNPSIDNHSVVLESPPQQQQQPSSTPQQSQKTQPQSQDTALSSSNEPAHPLPTTAKKRPISKGSGVTLGKKVVTTSIAPTPPKPTPAQCLCKRKSTNKPGPVRYHKAASTTSQTYQSKQPEWRSLNRNKILEKHLPTSHPTTPIPTDDHTSTNHPTAIHPSDDTPPPSQANVSGWLFEQQQLHLQQQRADNDKMNAPTAEETDQHSFYRHNSSLPTTGIERNRPQQHQEALDLFDDVLQYLDTFSDFGTDADLQQDISLILSNFNRNEADQQSTISSSSSYWSHYPSSSLGFYQQLQLYSILVNHGMAACSQYIVESVSKGLSWCKFLSVLSLACLISLGRGPDHMLLSLDDLDYLDLLCDQDEFVVDSYYL